MPRELQPDGRASHAPAGAELPSKQQLNRATAIAAGVAALLLFTTVLPAEYGFDPSGVGRVLGLTPMGEMKLAQAAEAEANAAAPEEETADLTLDDTPAAATSVNGSQTGQVRLTLAPGGGTEVKRPCRRGPSFATSGALGVPS